MSWLIAGAVVASGNMKYTINSDAKCTCSNPRHHAIWDLEPEKIIKSLTQVFDNHNIDQLTKDTYDFIKNLSGFIAHCNIDGFKSEYQDLRKFIDDLLESSDVDNSAHYLSDDYFSKGEQFYYYAQKCALLKAIKKLAIKHKDKIDNAFNEQEKIEDIEFAGRLLAKYGLTIAK